jgi:hypothetical protein
MKTKFFTRLSIAGILGFCLICIFLIMSIRAKIGDWFGYDTLQVTSTGPTIEKLEKLSHLVTHRVTVADVLTASENNYRGSWIIKGDALLSVDLGAAEIRDKNLTLRKAKIILPQPRAIQPRVDHNKTILWSIEKGNGLAYVKASLGFGDSNNLRNNAMKTAQRLVEEACRSSDCIKESRERTAMLLHNLYSELGWDVEIEWRKE